MVFVKSHHYELGTNGFKKLLDTSNSYCESVVSLHILFKNLLTPEISLFNCFPVICVYDESPIFAFKFELKTKYEANGFLD